MFTGIVEELGVVTAIEPRQDAASLTVECHGVLDDVAHGASVAVNGVCLTVTSFVLPPDTAAGGDVSGPGGSAGSAGAAGGFTADVMLETLRRSALGDLAVGDRVNLERPVRLSDRLGGHLVQGHVDGVGVVLERVPAEHWEVVRVSLPPGLDRYLVEKGSVTVDGVSLTIVDVRAAAGGEPASFSVSLIPTTLAVTTLGTRAVGDKVNIEVDVVAKYVEKLHADLNGSH
ncbi:riboflavin synthase [Parafrankia discariae]|uniref:riboflavin synthase n=1 Tax=Parafrankia discariae TaxID=365528 RepID=UPI0003620FC6|nr:riboflavin synthase [Parafrankia discariae]